MRALILAALLVVTGQPAAAAEPTAYASFRVVRATPGEPATPEITLPSGYTPVAGSSR